MRNQYPIIYPIIKEFEDSDGDLWEVRREIMGRYVHILYDPERPIFKIPVEDIPKLIKALKAVI